MSFTVPTQVELKAQLVTALRNAIAGLDTSSHGDAVLKAGAIAHVLEGMSHKLSWVDDQKLPDTASSENLARHAETYALDRRAATAAEGTVTFTGTPAAAVPLGTTFTKSDGWLYETTAADVIGGGGSVDIACVATTAGADGNASAGEVFTLTAPPAGVDSTATAAAEFSGGRDEETDAELLDRLLARIQHPPAGGTETDWEAWALDVDGVLEAYAFPLRKGPGTCDVVIFTEGPGGVRAAPGPALIAAVTAYLDTVRPVTTASFEVLAASEVAVNVTVDALAVEDGYDPTAVAAAVAAAVEDHFPQLEPGETLFLTTDLHAVIAAVEGVQDYTLTAPVVNVSASVTASVVEVLVLGVVTVTPV